MSNQILSREEIIEDHQWKLERMQIVEEQPCAFKKNFTSL
jgi:hypothetical protein